MIDREKLARFLAEIDSDLEYLLLDLEDHNDVGAVDEIRESIEEYAKEENLW